MAVPEDLLLPVALLALAVLPAEILLLSRHRDRVKARLFLRYREYVRLWMIAGGILTPGFILLFLMSVLDRAAPDWPYGLLSLASILIALCGCLGVLRALRGAKGGAEGH
ncbi:MAG: hypothetical protein QXO51_05460 [Halobacteria archaeon]